MILIPCTAVAQSKPNKAIDLLFFESKINYGYIIPHHTEIWGLTSGFFPSLELSVFRQTDGRHDFQYMRNYPQIGITYRFSNFGGSESLGVLNALLPVIKIPILLNNKGKLLFSMGAGLAYMSKKYDPFENYQNLTIGSHLNAAVKFELIFQQQLSRRVYLNSGVSMFHISNGTVKTPNYGLNMPSVFAGIQWKLTAKPIQFEVPEKLGLNKGNSNIRLMGAAASKQIFGLPGKDFRVMTGSATFLYYYKNTARVSIGGDLVYDESAKHRMEKAGVSAGNWWNVSKKGLNIGHEWVFSKLAVSVSLGYYFYKPLEDDYLIYNKIGFNYALIEQVYIAVNLQTHWAKADFLSFGLGVNL